MAASKEINREIIFSIDTQLKPNEWYQKIFITETFLKGNLIRCMHIGNAEYGPETCYIPGCFDALIKVYCYSLLFALAFLEKTKNRFLVIGLGGGWAPMFLRKHFPDSIIDVVEIDGAVLEAAKHMGFCEDEDVNIFIQSLEHFLKSSDLQQYDLIFHDIGKKNIGHWQMKKLRNILVPEGVLAVNVYTEAPSLEDNKEDVDTFQDFFNKIHVFNTTKFNINYICHGSKGEKTVDADINTYTDSIWRNLPDYKYKKKAEDKLKQYYVRSFSQQDIE